MTNSTRDLELDIAKGLAVLFMILVHTQDSFATPELKESLLGGLIDVMGGVPAAPVFMFLMGAGVAFSSATPVKLAKRGGILILLAVALNLLRGGIPYSLAGLLLNDSARLGLGLAQTFFIDILFFAGLSMLVLAILRCFYAPLWLYPVLTILAGLLNLWLLENSHLNGPWWGSPFFGATPLSFFPLLSWVAYPLLGVVYGSLLKQAANKSVFYWRGFAFATLVVLLGIVLFSSELERELGYLGEYGYYHHQLLGNLFFSACSGQVFSDTKIGFFAAISCS